MRNKSIKAKLIIITMLTCFVTLSLVCITVFTYSYYKMKKGLITEITGYANAIGNNCTAAITFDDPDSARENLLILASEPKFTYACILTKDKKIFAEHKNPNYPDMGININKAFESPIQFHKGHLDLHQPIILDDKIIGYIYIRSELKELYSQIRNSIILVVSILFVASGIAYILISNLQGIISSPIGYLADLSKTIADEKNYSIRAEKYSENKDEIGELVRTFNEMLNQIEKRDIFLKEAQSTLEQRVEERTKELQKTVVELGQSRHAALSIMEDAEYARREAENERDKMEAMLKSIGDGVLVVDRSSRIILINRAAENIMGWRNDEVIEKSADEIFVIVHEETGEKVESPLVKVFSENRVVELSNHTALIRKDGTQISIADSGAPIHDKKGNLLGAVLVFRDISASKQIEKEKEQLQSQLLQSQKMESIGILAGGIAHDFNNLLQGILGYTSIVKSRIKEDDGILSHINHIELAAERAADLTQQLLSFARKGKYDVVPIKPERIVEQVIALLSRTFDRNIEISKEFDENLLYIRGDMSQIHQAIMNVCINAREAMPAGGKLNISVKNIEYNEAQSLRHIGLKAGKYVAFRVADTGAGMSDEIMSKIFEPFFTTKEPGKGTGLGLSMVFGVVQNHGGSVEVESKVGNGSTFTLYFPAENADVEEPMLPQPVIENTEQNKATVVPVSNKNATTVLIVDDEEIVNSVAQDMLKMSGYMTISATNGSEAVKIYKDRYDSIDVVLLDMIMPELGGLETFRELKKVNPNVKVIISSGYEEDERSQEIMKEGAFTYLRKPFLMQKLIDAINEAVNKSEAVKK